MALLDCLSPPTWHQCTRRQLSLHPKCPYGGTLSKAAGVEEDTEANRSDGHILAVRFADNRAPALHGMLRMISPRFSAFVTGHDKNLINQELSPNVRDTGGS